MKLKTKMLLRSFALMFLSIAVLDGCRGNDIQLQKAFNDFSKILAQESLDGLSLKIYYIYPPVFTRAPLTVDDLIHCDFAQKNIIGSERLEEHRDILNQMNADSLIPVKRTSYLDARLCYIFETDSDGKILEIAIGGANNSAFVNGIEVEYNDFFRDILNPFVTEEVMNELSYVFS